jgi:hypothetical protein
MSTHSSPKKHRLIALTQLLCLIVGRVTIIDDDKTIVRVQVNRLVL